MAKVKDRIGEENYNKFGSKMIITRYINAHNIDVYFPEYNWTAINKQYSKFKKGDIGCPYQPTVFGIGYIGEGKYNVKENNKTTECYTKWHSMLQRCYDDKYHIKKPTYKDCEVCEEWLNYQNFAKWYYENYYKIKNETMCLDKDILVKGNKIYSPSTCIFVPKRINSLFIKSDKARGEYPIGVYYYKQTNRFKAQCNNGYKNRINLGYYNTLEEAFNSYKTYKENLIKEVANKYKELIPTKLYQAMINYEIEIND